MDVKKQSAGVFQNIKALILKNKVNKVIFVIIVLLLLSFVFGGNDKKIEEAYTNYVMDEESLIDNSSYKDVDSKSEVVYNKGDYYVVDNLTTYKFDGAPEKDAVASVAILYFDKNNDIRILDSQGYYNEEDRDRIIAVFKERVKNEA